MEIPRFFQRTSGLLLVGAVAIGLSSAQPKAAAKHEARDIAPAELIHPSHESANGFRFYPTPSLDQVVHPDNEPNLGQVVHPDPDTVPKEVRDYELASILSDWSTQTPGPDSLSQSDAPELKPISPDDTNVTSG